MDKSNIEDNDDHIEISNMEQKTLV